MRKNIIAFVVLAAVSASASATSDFVGSGDYRADKAAQYTRDQGQDAAIHEVHMNMLTKYSESWGLEDRANIAGLQESKVDKSTFEADQQRQDTHINAVQNAAQSANEKADAGAVRMDGIEHQAGVLDSRVGQTEVRLDTVEGGVRETNTQLTTDRENTNTRIEQEQSTRATNDRVITDRVSKEEVNRSADTAGIRNSFTERNAVVDNRFADTQQRIDENKASQAKVNKAMSATLDNHEQRIGSLESNTNKKFANLDKRIGDVEDNANAGTAAAFAQANIPQVMAGGEFGIGAGAGTYSGESALAVGASYAPRDNLVLKATVSTDSQHNFGAGAGIMVSFH